MIGMEMTMAWHLYVTAAFLLAGIGLVFGAMAAGVGCLIVGAALGVLIASIQRLVTICASAS